jgi:hypothetical protein
MDLKKLQLSIPWDLQDNNNQKSKFYSFGPFLAMKWLHLGAPQKL